MRCNVCGRMIKEFIACSECGVVYCGPCARSDLSMRSLGICSNCEEAWAAEEDLEDLEE
jgi:hydrogenase maturation factor HypF (carbamoyltransferase family)